MDQYRLTDTNEYRNILVETHIDRYEIIETNINLVKTIQRLIHIDRLRQ